MENIQIHEDECIYKDKHTLSVSFNSNQLIP